MENNSYLFAFATSVLAASAIAGTNPGIVKLNDEAGSYLYSASKIKPGDTIYFQYQIAGKVVCCASGSWKSATLVAADPNATDYKSGRQLYRYRLASSPQGKDGLPFVGMAVFGKHVTARAVSPSQLAFGPGAASAGLSLCTSQEGVHVVGEDGGAIYAHLYLNLAYDIENPTCGEFER